MGDTNPYLPLADQGWDAFFRLAPPNAAERLRAIFADPEPIVRGHCGAATDARPRRCVGTKSWLAATNR